VPIVIFPEGTRSREGGLLPFKDGAFRLAIEAGATILPMAVSGTAAAWPKHDWRAGRARGRLRIGAPISTAGMDLADVPRLKERAKSAIEALLGELRGEAAHPAAD
jgi:1-acyl-sn-glycerol-3-phosphate acyltransferase